MALIDHRSFLRYFGIYAFVCSVIAFLAKFLPPPSSAGAVALYGIAFFLYILTVGIPLFGIIYSALHQALRAKRLGWFIVILFANVFGAYAYAFWVHEPSTEEAAA